MPRRLLRIAGLLLVAALAWSAPAQAQFSASYKFLEAVKKKDGQAVTDALAEPGSTLALSRDITSGETSLHIVVARRDKVWLEFLISKGANVNQSDFKGVSPLMLACNLNFVEGVEVLAAKGARVDQSNASGETPLIAAVHSRNTELMRVLLKAGADPDRADNSGRTARDYAALEGKSGALLAVIEREAKAKSAKGSGKPVFGPAG
ncbi:MAG: ankyrin repeat domain-containing protein [Novosphingobium sp.]